MRRDFRSISLFKVFMSYACICICLVMSAFMGCDSGDSPRDDLESAEAGRERGEVEGGAIVGGVIVGGVIAGGTIAGGWMEGGAIAGDLMRGGTRAGGAVTGGAIAGEAIEGGAAQGGSLEGGEVAVEMSCDPIIPTTPSPSAPLPPLMISVGEDNGGGVDPWERAAYQRLITTLDAHPGVHFIATWDVENAQLIINGGDPQARAEVRIERIDHATGSRYEVVAGDLAQIFPRTDPRRWPNLESLYSAYEPLDPSGYLDLGYVDDDPRLGLIPRAAQIYPNPIERLVTVFEAPHAPDALYGVWPGQNGGRGSHGGLGLLQSRATLMLGGAGVRARQFIEEQANLTDVLPTILAALGAPTTGGVGPDGVYEDGLYLLRQDGRVLWEALDLNPCVRPKHVVVILYDGLLASEINHLVHADNPEVELPHMRALMREGSTYLYGAAPGFPTMSAAGHITSGIGLLPGHSGVLSNSYFDRATQSEISPFVILEDPQGFLRDRARLNALLERMFTPDIETAAEAVHRALGAWSPTEDETERGAFVAVINELMFRGADFSTPQFLNPNHEAEEPDAPQPKLGPKSLQTYQLADGLAVLQIQRLLGDTSKPVPTLLQTSFLTTDKAGEMSGPHARLTREVIVELDARVGAVVSAYEQRGALAETMFIFTSDHGMELQDVARRTDIGAFFNESGVGVSFARTGLIYLRSLRLEVTPNPDAPQAFTVRVSHHDTGAPIEGASVRCASCTTAEIMTDAEGRAALTVAVGSARETARLEVSAQGFTEQRWPLSDISERP